MVDDSSDDGTADVARRHGATVVTTEPPAGLAGQAVGLRRRGRARPGHPPAVPRRRHRARQRRPRGARSALGGRDRLVSVQPHHRTVRAYEQLSAFCNVVSMMGSGAFAWPRPLGPAVAFGPCSVHLGHGVPRRRRPRRGARARWSRTWPSPATTPPPASPCASSAAATWCASACTPAAPDSSSRAGARTWPRAPERRRGSPSPARVVYVAAAAAASVAAGRRRLALAGGRCRRAGGTAGLLRAGRRAPALGARPHRHVPMVDARWSSRCRSWRSWRSSPTRSSP